MRQLLYIGILLVFLLISINRSYAEDFEIKHADLLEVENEEITIRGNIVINFKDAFVEAPYGKVETVNGKAEKAVFNEGAKIKLKDRLLEADKITISIKEKTISAEGNVLSSLKDKENNLINISSDYQELKWTGEGAKASGNLMTKYKDTFVNSDEAQIIYKNKKPYLAIFYGLINPVNIKQPTSSTTSKEIIFDLFSKNTKAIGNVKTLIWPDNEKPQQEQDPVTLLTEELLIDNKTHEVIAKSTKNNVKVTYQETTGESKEALLTRNKENDKPEQIIFKGNANVSQLDKQLSSQEIVFNFRDKKLTSITKTNIRPKTLIFKNQTN